MTESEKYERAEVLTDEISRRYREIVRLKQELKGLTGTELAGLECNIDDMISPLSFNLIGLYFAKKAQATELQEVDQ